jgi:transcriptional regulator with XRE-family HTH domain
MARVIRLAVGVQLGPAIAQLRAMNGLTRQALADALTATTNRSAHAWYLSLWRWETGTHQPDLSSVAPVLAELGYELALVPVLEQSAGDLTPDRRPA